MLTISGIGLIKLVRRITGCGLVIAKDTVSFFLCQYLGMAVNSSLGTDYMLSAQDVIVLLSLAVNVTSENGEWVMSPKGQVLETRAVGYTKLHELLNGLNMPPYDE